MNNNSQNLTHTKGNIIVEHIKIGDVHYEYGYGICIKATVKTLPVKQEQEDGDIYWSWKSERDNGQIVDYGVSKRHSHYGPNLYDYEAYKVKKHL